MPAAPLPTPPPSRASGPRAPGPGAPGVPLRQLLLALGDALVELQTAPAGLDVPVRGLALLDPEDPPGAAPGDLVLAIGVRGRAALPAVRAAGRAHSAGVVVRAPTDDTLRDAAEDAGVALLSCRPEARWEQLHALVRTVLAHADPYWADGPPDADPAATAEGGGEPYDPYRASASAGGGGGGTGSAGGPPDAGDLFSLAQTTAVLTGGIVSVEDAANRVLAYSRSSDQDEVDDLRRLSILGWQGPEPYLARLRDWGVFQRLRSSDEVVRIDDHPELGIRRRLAVGIRAGHQYLGTIWVQQGAGPLTDRAEQVLRGASRVAAAHLVRRRREVSGDLRLTRTLVTGLLEGSTGPQSLSTHLGLDPRRPAAVLGFAQAAGPDSPAGEAPAGELTRTEVTDLVSVHAAARHPGALVVPIGARVYVLLPELTRHTRRGGAGGSGGTGGTGGAPGSAGTGGGAGAGAEARLLVGWAQEITDAARSHLGVGLRGAVGRTVPVLAEAAASRREADRILDAMAEGGVRQEVAALPDVQSEVLVREVLALLAAHPAIRDPRLERLLAHDARHRSRLAESLLAYLDAFGEVREAAERLHVHPNTLRYRVRRAEQLTGLDLSRPEQRLLTMLQLRLPPTEQS